MAVLVSLVVWSPGFSEPDSAPREASATLTYLHNNSWTPEERTRFYRTSEGPWYLPYAWFEILEALDSRADQIRLFRATENLQRYGLILHSSLAPDGLPLGFVISQGPTRRLGLTCAGCHTGQIDYRGKAFVVDGGAPMADLTRFLTALYQALGATLQNVTVLPDGTVAHDDEKFGRFARKFFQKDHPTATELDMLRASVKEALKKVERSSPPKEKQRTIYPSPWGYGRLDALGRGGNTLLAPLSESNYWPASAPVSVPVLWGAYDYAWVQWNGSIMQPMARNIGQAITGSRRLDYRDPLDWYASDVDVVTLHDLERLTRKLTPPRWPHRRFDAAEDNAAFALDPMKAAAGKKLYNQLCASCHVPSYAAPNAFGQRFLDVHVIPVAVIGTDPTHAMNFGERSVDTGRLGLGTMRAVEFLKSASSEIRRRRYAEQEIPPAQYDEMDGFRENEWRAEVCRPTDDGTAQTCWRGYVARPLAGVWATPPFLHNGSVPTLYQLLSPVSERSRCFYVGQREFDPVHVGYAVKECHGAVPPKGSDDAAYYDQAGFKFFVSITGNSHAGHEFHAGGQGKFGRVLQPAERLAIIEYLKTCDLELSRDQESWQRTKDQPPILTDCEVTAGP